MTFGQTPMNTDSLGSNRLYLKTGIEPTSQLTVSYERFTGIQLLKQPLTLYTEASLFNFDVSFQDYEVKSGGVLPFNISKHYSLVNRFNLSFGSVNTQHFNSKKTAFSNEIAVGRYHRNWFVSLTVEYEKIMLTHLKHSDFYRQVYYESAIDGWYKGAGGLFQFGIEGGMTVLKNFEILLELKIPRTNRLNNYYGSPMHLNLGIGYRY